MKIKFLSIILCSVLSFFSISNRNEVKNIKVGKNTISVMFFGAMGDGVTDDSDAFQKAIVYCVKNNKTLYVPRTSTNYRLNKTIRVSLSSHDKIKIISNQAVIMPEIINSSSAYKLTAFTENVFLSIGRKMNSIDSFENLEELNNTSIDISGLIFDGANVKHLERFLSYKQTIYIGAQLIAQSVKLKNCEFRNIQGYGLRIHEVSASKILNCKFINVGGRGDTAFVNGSDFDAFGDAIYHAKVNKNAVITIEDCVFIGKKQKNKRSRSALTFEFSLFPYNVNLKNLDIEGYAKCLHIEETAATLFKIVNVNMKDFNFGIANVLNDKTVMYLDNCVIKVAYNDGNDAGDALAFLNYNSTAKIYVNRSILDFNGRHNAYQSAVGLINVKNSVINGNNTNFFFADGSTSFFQCRFINFGGKQISFLSLNPNNSYIIEDSKFEGLLASDIKSDSVKLEIR
ncbi:glycosyl hydrolase family 28-related protein [Flavobacterium frigoris]|uniref:Pectate lyase superfamily protein n=1 Tax=Flavobacterium frigoris TaxID=229204 RepID=A0A1H9Q1M9_FLAFI|nr:glycosyl hydrolase family 28-related protein [Flavobacterium frigoris]SER53985.1 Pectate lyase superfamily protein [Flavobacterium frigoris]